MTEFIDYEPTSYYGSPLGDHPVPEVPLGDQFRAAFAEKEAEDERARKDAELTRQNQLQNTLSEWFNGIAVKGLPDKLQSLTTAVRSRFHFDPAFSFRTEFPGEDIHALNQIDFESLSGLKALYSATRKLKINFSVTARHIDGDVIEGTNGANIITVDFDARLPYGAGNKINKYFPRA